MLMILLNHEIIVKSKETNKLILWNVISMKRLANGGICKQRTNIKDLFAGSKTLKLIFQIQVCI